MGCYKINWVQKGWWSKYDIRIGRGSHFQLNEYMSRVRFEQILTRLKYTDEEPPLDGVCYSTSRSCRRHVMPTCPPTSSEVGYLDWMNQ